MKFLSFFESRSIFQILFMDILNFLKHMGENDVFSNPLYEPDTHFQKKLWFLGLPNLDSAEADPNIGRLRLVNLLSQRLPTAHPASYFSKAR